MTTRNSRTVQDIANMLFEYLNKRKFDFILGLSLNLTFRKRLMSYFVSIGDPDPHL